MAGLALDPGAPLQMAFTAFRWVDDAVLAQFRLASWRHDRLCAAAGYSTRESMQHTCQNDCHCDGARTCSFFGFCVGDSSAEGDDAPSSWELDASVITKPSDAVRAPRDAPFEYVPVSHGVDMSGSRLGAPFVALSGERWVGAWGSDFSLHGVAGVAMQLEVAREPPHGALTAHVRLRGPEGYSIRVQLEHAGNTYHEEEALSERDADTWQRELRPLPHRHDSDTPQALGGWLVGGVSFPADESVLACRGWRWQSARNVPEGCAGLRFTIRPLGVAYLPTFYAWQPGTPARTVPSPAMDTFARRLADTFSLGADMRHPQLWSGALRRGSSLAAAFVIAGVGRFRMHVYPAGDGSFFHQLFGACRRRTPRAGSNQRMASERSR